MEKCEDGTECGCYVNQCLGGIERIGGEPKIWEKQASAGPAPAPLLALAPGGAAGPAFAPGGALMPAPAPAPAPGGPAVHHLWGCKCCFRYDGWFIGKMPMR